MARSCTAVVRHGTYGAWGVLRDAGIHTNQLRLPSGACTGPYSCHPHPKTGPNPMKCALHHNPKTDHMAFPRNTEGPATQTQVYLCSRCCGFLCFGQEGPSAGSLTLSPCRTHNHPPIPLTRCNSVEQCPPQLQLATAQLHTPMRCELQPAWAAVARQCCTSSKEGLDMHNGA